MTGKKRRYLWVGLLALLVGAGVIRYGVAFTNERRAERIVRRALAAETTTAHTGVKEARVRVGGRWVVSQAMVARQPPNLRRIHYITPPLTGITVWQSHGETYRYEPKNQQLEIYDKSQHRPAVAGEEEALVLRNYQPQLEGEETIAGRTAERVRLAPRRPGDAWKRIWVDRQTGLRLGTADYDGNDHLLRQTRFLEVSFESVDPEDFRPPPFVMKLARRTYSDEEQHKSVAQVSQEIGFPVRLPRFVPEGYEFDGAYTYPCECGCEKPAAQVRWSNGLTTISMFQCGHPCGRGAPCTVTAGPHSVAVHAEVGSESILFFGETDRASLEKMARSLKGAATRSP
jgi:negative regulator of sigma E activity